jgi:hypothetical protein
MLPMLLLWLAATLTITCYWTVPGFTALLDAIAGWQREYGWKAAFTNRLVFSGLIPGAFMLTMRSLRPRRPFVVIAAQSLWCGAWGVICDKMYVFVDWVFGSGTDVLSVVLKTLFDQLPWTVLVIAPANAAFYFWAGRGFSWQKTRAEWPDGFWRVLVLPFLVSNWCGWIPVTVTVFLFPLPLRVHIVGFVSAFWTLMCIYIGSSQFLSRSGG